jgi:HSP20 family molecular chaperone IbpA
MFADMSKQWRAQQGSISGSVYWPGGGFTFKNGQWSPVNPNQSPSSSSKDSAVAPSLPLDVVSAGDFYLLYADVPGLAKSDLSIKLSGPNKEPRVLKISGQRTAPYQQQQQGEGQGDKVDAGSSSVVQQQRVFGSFASSWELPGDADSEGISAKVSEGVLTVTVPKKQQQPPQPEEDDDDGQDIFVA